MLSSLTATQTSCERVRKEGRDLDSVGFRVQA